ncbi:MAG TPA: EF-hand domain-containing protein [Polyangiaceae bacterium]|jgi:calmodulin|nr:EF-hand domain-containing protein [Polyangiaceae bacterium]
MIIVGRFDARAPQVRLSRGPDKAVAMENSALRARFDGYDRDGDGRIELAEFWELLDALGLGYEEAQARSAFGSLDQDDDGQIDFAEFSRWWVGH